MYNKDKLNSLGVKVSYMKDKVEGKRRLGAEEREELKSKIVLISEAITQILNDNEIELDIKNQLSYEKRNQIVLINRVLVDLERVINKTRENIE